MKKLLTVLLTLLSINFSVADTKNNGIVHQSAEGKYFEVINNMRNSILGKGIHIAHELNASDMLNRTGRAFGYDKQVYLHANILEFCSAKLSHLLSRSNPQNITACPFTISIYELKTQPDIIHVVYHQPPVTKGAEKIALQINALIDGIIEEGLW